MTIVFKSILNRGNEFTLRFQSSNLKSISIKNESVLFRYAGLFIMINQSTLVKIKL